MGCGVGATNHYAVEYIETPTDKRRKPFTARRSYCGDLGYVWDQATWDRMLSGESKMVPCKACIAMMKLDKLMAECEAIGKAKSSLSLEGELLVHVEKSASVWEGAKVEVAKARMGESAERIGFALEMADQYGGVLFPDEGLVVFREQDLVGMMSVLGFSLKDENPD